MQKERYRYTPDTNIKITGKEMVADILFQEGLLPSDREAIIVFNLNNKNRIISLDVVSVGTVNQALVHPRHVFREAVRLNASGIILAHNHPSNDTTPSKVDVKITKKLRKCGSLLNIPLVDHVVVGNAPEKEAYSFRENNWGRNIEKKEPKSSLYAYNPDNFKLFKNQKYVAPHEIKMPEQGDNQ
jgi:DNA repair protein RadC